MRSSQRFDAVVDAAAQLAAAPDLEALAHALFSGIVRFDVMAVALHVVTDERLLLLQERGLPPAAVVQLRALERDAPLMPAQAAASGNLELIAAADASDPLLAGVASELGAGALLVLPLVEADRSIGVLTALLSGTSPTLDDDLRALGALARVFAGHLGRALAQADERRTARRLEAVRAAVLELQAIADLGPLLARLADRARVLTDAEAAVAGVIADDDTFAPWALVVSEAPAISAAWAPRPRGLLDWPCQGRTVRVDDVHTDPRFEGVPAGHPSIDSLLGVPLRAQGQVVGSLHVADKRNSGGFSAEDQATLELLAEHAAIAIAAATRARQARRELARPVERVDAVALNAKALVERLPDVVFRLRLHPHFAVEFVSASITRVTGRAAESYYADPTLVGRWVHPADRGLFEAALRAPELFRHPIEFRLVRQDGGLVWIESRWMPVIENGVTVAVEGVARDITVRKRGEGEMERLLERVHGDRMRLQAVIESSPVGMMLIEDPRGVHVFANRAAEQLFGHAFDPNGSISHWADQLRDKDGHALAAIDLPALRALAGEAIDGLELNIIAWDGREVPVLVSAVPLRDGSGAVSGAVIIYKDVSTLRQLEQLREEWTSIVAHDLRQPIAVVRMQAHGLSRTLPPGDQAAREQLGHIHAAVAQLNRMIADLLDLSRLETKHLELCRREVEPAAMARIIVERLRELVAPHVVELGIEPDLPALSVDPERIEQVLTNLVTNAARYGFADTSITLTVTRRGGELVWAVSNLGPGIAQTELPRLFQRFHRAERARDGGLGLGLYIARGLVEAHGGRLWAESEPGGRTTFSFTTPL